MVAFRFACTHSDLAPLIEMEAAGYLRLLGESRVRRGKATNSDTFSAFLTSAHLQSSHLASLALGACEDTGRNTLVNQIELT